MSPISKLEAIRQYLAKFPMQDTYDVISALRNQGVVVSYSQVYETKRKKGAKMANQPNQQSGVADIYLERFVKFGKETAGKRHHIRNAVKKLHTYLGTGTVSSISELEHFLESMPKFTRLHPLEKAKQYLTLNPLREFTNDEFYIYPTNLEEYLRYVSTSNSIL